MLSITSRDIEGRQAGPFHPVPRAAVRRVECWLYRHPSPPCSRSLQRSLGRALLGVALSRFEGPAPVSADIDGLRAWCRANHGLDVSISHSESWFAVALGPGRLGVDIQGATRQRDWCAIARAFYSDSETRRLEGLPDGELSAAFLQAWTLKESAIKAIAGNLFEHLNTLECLDAGRVRTPRGSPAERWWAWSGSAAGLPLSLSGFAAQPPAGIRFLHCGDLERPVDEAGWKEGWKEGWQGGWKEGWRERWKAARKEAQQMVQGEFLEVLPRDR